jgi:hypothetical protein
MCAFFKDSFPLLGLLEPGNFQPSPNETEHQHQHPTQPTNTITHPATWKSEQVRKKNHKMSKLRFDNSSCRPFFKASKLGKLVEHLPNIFINKLGHFI